MEINLQLPKWAKKLFEHHRYKVIYGGRGGGKSWTVARVLLLMALKKPLRIMCAREIQNSIKESVYQLLVDQISLMNLQAFYKISGTEIRSVNGSRFFFVGLRHLSADQIKSYEGVDICWVEEAHTISERSWQILLPTVRKPGSEIWITFNPDKETDPVYVRFVAAEALPEDVLLLKVTWRDNPWFPEVLEKERQYWQKHYPESYANVWEGEPRRVVEGAFFANELQKAFEEGRITHVPVEDLPVYTAWDLGIGDMTAIWFFQVVGQEVHFIDYYENFGLGLHYYAKVLRDKGYMYGEHFAPHDIKVRELGTGLSRYERAKQLGINFTILPTDQIKFEDGIEIVRSQFPRVWIDKERCKRGIEALKYYRAEVRKDEHGIVFNRPRHDWASHGADAFRYACIALTKKMKQHRLTPEEIRQLYERYAPPPSIWT